MHRNLRAKSDSTVDFSGNLKIVAEGAVVFNNENNGKNTKNRFIYKLKGLFIFSRSDIILVRADVCRVGR